MGFRLQREGEDHPRCKASDLRMGTLARVTETSCAGQIVLRTYDSMVSLSQPQSTWVKDCTLILEPLPRGTVITLTVE
jgi:hypothetical protein